MRSHRPFIVRVLAVALTLLTVGAGPAPVARTRPVGYADYDAWKSIHSTRLSDDGRYLAYVMVPGDGDPTLVVRDLTNGKETTEAHGRDPVFTADARNVIFAIEPPKSDVDAAKKAKLPEDQLPKKGLGIIELETGKRTTFARVKDVQVARDGGRYIAFTYEAPLKPPSPASPTPASIPSPAASATPAPKAEKKKAIGTELVVRDLQTGSNVSVPNVTEFVLADDDRNVAYATQTLAGLTDGVRIRRLADGTVADVLTGNGRYTNLAIARTGTELGFLSDVRTYAHDVPRQDAYVADISAPVPAAQLAVGEETSGLVAATAPSLDGKLTFSKDGQRLFLGVAAAPTPIPSGTPVPLAVDLWTYKDLRLQSAQQHDAPVERKRTYPAVYDIAARRFAQLGSPDMRTIQTNENPTFALGLDARPYAIASSWTGEDDADVYAVALADGKRRLLMHQAAQPTLSPGGAYAVSWDRALRHWIAVRTADGKRTVLAAHANVTFYNETDDHPAPPPPYGLGGWVAGDRGVIVYDRYDAWMVDPATGTATNLTRGTGRATHVVFSVMQTDRDADAYPAGKRFLLSRSDQRTYASGYAVVDFAGGVPRTLLNVDKSVNTVLALDAPVHERIAPPIKARNADRVVFTEESYREFRDLWSSDLTFDHPLQVSNVNPQLADYRWGTEHLIAYKNAHGTPLRAVMLTPDNFDPHKKYPLLVYFYEKWSDQFHTFYPPAPRYPTLSRYVSHGYVVLLPDVVYRAGHPGQSALDCILAGVNDVAKRGFIDRSRIGIAGHSWAAYQINYLLTQTHVFRAAEAGAAVTNMTSAYGGIRLESGNVRESQYEVGQSRIGAPPWERPDLYLENSGLFHIKNITTPYLTMHNDADTAVPFEQGVEFITAMRRLGKPAYMFVFNGKEHNLRDTPADREDLKFWSVAFDEWFDYWLQNGPRPAWFDGVDYLHRGERDVRPLFGESP